MAVKRADRLALKRKPRVSEAEDETTSAASIQSQLLDLMDAAQRTTATEERNTLLITISIIYSTTTGNNCNKFVDSEVAAVKNKRYDRKRFQTCFGP
ncbi:unnamed protein product [Soboliphyme baturini]|uniref:Uncharacterized protein n=1 Tax=Soboliphyme baturini TaxID=241478 RepID=A0A183IWC2_9BILA|nr:unnamed protein product [Soboliphyme baturini]